MHGCRFSCYKATRNAKNERQLRWDCHLGDCGLGTSRINGTGKLHVKDPRIACEKHTVGSTNVPVDSQCTVFSARTSCSWIQTKLRTIVAASRRAARVQKRMSDSSHARMPRSHCCLTTSSKNFRICGCPATGDWQARQRICLACKWNAYEHAYT